MKEVLASKNWSLEKKEAMGALYRELAEVYEPLRKSFYSEAVGRRTI